MKAGFVTGCTLQSAKRNKISAADWNNAPALLILCYE